MSDDREVQFGPAVIDALRTSIEKWKKNAVVECISDVDFGPKSCPLCLMFNLMGTCKGCPVARAAGVPGCRNTPYPHARNAWTNWQSRLFDYENSDLAVSAPPRIVLEHRLEEAHSEFIVAAKEELAFLRSLKQPKPCPVEESGK